LFRHEFPPEVEACVGFGCPDIGSLRACRSTYLDRFSRT
jgi:hypothetical protein